MPLFLVAMPLVFLTLAPGVELSPFYSLVPVTGVALLMQRLMGPGASAPSTWLYFLPVLAPMALYSWLSLRWAIEQFKREEVLFREAERLDIKLWLRRLFREKEALPSVGQAAFCFALIMALRWLSLSLSSPLPVLIQTSVVVLAFVGAPAVFMALQLTRRPREALGLKPVSPGEIVTALILAVVVLGPLVQMTLSIYDWLSVLREMREEHQGVVQLFEELRGGRESIPWTVLALIILPALCEEIAFRGLILTGLRRRFRTWTAVLLGAFLFSLYHMNVFQLLPTFFLGVVLGLLTVRSGSVLPAILFHMLHNTLLVGSTLLQPQLDQFEQSWEIAVYLRAAVMGLSTLLACLLLWRIGFSSPLPGLPQPETGLPPKKMQP
jgi:sodium transport system permease protein